jgi:hypothetical protein
MDNYLRVKTEIENNKCTMITTFEEFEKKRETVMEKFYHYVRIDFVGICGHNSSAVVTNFMNRKTGIRCKECVNKDTSNTLKNKTICANETETNSINIIEKYLSDTYDITRTKEGCRADLLIKKKGSDKYIPIQVKSTIKILHKMYSFRGINKDYANMIILCVCTSENKLWVVPFDDIKHLSCLNISMRSKYNKYLVEDNNLLSEHIEKYADNCYTLDIDKLMTPIAPLQRQEQEYVKKRESLVSFLEYKYPEVQNTPTDFIVNGKKVQEKVAGLCTTKGKNAVLAHLASNNGKNEKGNRKFRTYRQGENEYYWIHSKIDNRFWIIPESILFKKGYISKADETINKKVLYMSHNTEWIKEYQYDYDNINKDKILDLFK